SSTESCSPSCRPSSENPAPTLPCSAASAPTVTTSFGFARSRVRRAVMIFVVLARDRSVSGFLANSTCPVVRSSTIAAAAVTEGAVVDGAGVWSSVGNGDGELHTPEGFDEHGTGTIVGGGGSGVFGGAAAAAGPERASTARTASGAT